jgi:O-antigen/teichoic acid export membrane protein
VLFPKLSAAGEGDARRELLCRGIAAAILMTVVVAAPLLIAIPHLLPLLFGVAFAPAVPVALVLVLAQVPASFAEVTVVALRGVGDWRAGPYCQGVALAAFALVAWPLAYHFGTTGVAGAVLIAHVASAGWLMIRLSSAMGLRPQDYLGVVRPTLDLIWDQVRSFIPHQHQR